MKIQSIKKSLKYFLKKKKNLIEKKKLQQNIRDKDEKIRQKNVTLSRQREELEELREKKEKLEYALETERFKKQQYDRKTAEYNALVESSQRQIDQGARDKYQLEEELKETQKQLQELQQSQIDPKEHENMVGDNKDLIETMKLKDQDILYTTKVVNQLQSEKTAVEKKYRNAIQNIKRLEQSFKDYKQKVESEDRGDQEKLKKDLQKIRQNYNNQVTRLQETLEEERESFRYQLSQRLRPGDIKSVQILLNNLSLDDLDEENYRDAYIKYKTARDNFAKKADDETSSRVQRLMFEELKKLADIRLDLLNMSSNRPAKTEAGKEFIRRTDQTLAGKFYRFRMRVKKYLAGTTLGAGIMGVFYLVYDFIKSVASASRSYATHYGYKAATAVGQAGAKITKALWDSSKSTKASLGLTAAVFVDKAKKDGYINTLYSWIYSAYYGIGYGLDVGVKTIEMGFDGLETILKASADTAKYVANNTSTVFLMIISAIGIIIAYKREYK